MIENGREKIKEICRNVTRGRAAGLSWEAIASAIGEPVLLLMSVPRSFGRLWAEDLAEERANLAKVPRSQWTADFLFTVTPEDEPADSTWPRRR